MSDKFHWTKDKIKSLIEKYRAMPELWDTKCNLYENRVKKQNAITKLSIELAIDEREIQRKIYNLRTQFFQEYKKIKRREPESKPCLVKWEFYDSLKFILSSHVRRKPIEQVSGHTSSHPNEIACVKVKMDTSSSCENLCSSPTSSISDRTTLVRRKLKRRSQHTQSKEDLNLDEYKIFGDYVASELRNIKSPIIRRKLKRALQLAIIQHSEMDDDNTYMSTTPSSTLTQHEHPSYFIKQGTPARDHSEMDIPSTSEDRNISEISMKSYFDEKD